ncbi:SH3 and PX domain-containing protein 2A [Stylophora pistillata]|uniref:SH3 and PX domain-containing protein 2A n=1 Tax=Stylophora pistillata TaxID=50429 RepID=A0A2B4RZ36_STYPI|nr:SH3 and PX domain-containing protein 2A [Stylophora pistillata]
MSFLPTTVHAKVERIQEFVLVSNMAGLAQYKSLPSNSIGEPVLLEQFVALENYQKKYLSDIGLTKGYTVGVIKKHESGWWHADCEGEIGWVPASFIKPLYGGNDDDDDDDIVTEIFAPGQEEIYMTTSSYRAKHCDEINFEIGVNLYVIEKTLDGWWRVSLKRISSGNSAKNLRRMAAVGLQLRDDEMDDIREGELQGRAQPNGKDRRIIGD